MRILNTLAALLTAGALTLPPQLFAFQDETPLKSTAKKARKKATEGTETPGQAASRTAQSAEKSAQPAKTVSESEIAAAKASGKVWVNTQTGVYHKEGKWYGATKQGKFMTEDEAVKAGYRASKTK
jgi:hypothetical protein